MLLRVVDGILTALDIPLSPWSNDVQSRIQSEECQLEPNLRAISLERCKTKSGGFKGLEILLDGEEFALE